MQIINQAFLNPIKIDGKGGLVGCESHLWREWRITLKNVSNFISIYYLTKAIW